MSDKTSTETATWWTYALPPMQSTAKPWTCPRCNRVYGPAALECHPCNSAIDTARKMGLGPGITNAGSTAGLEPDGL